LDETVEVLGLADVVFVHFPVDAGADEVPHRDPLFRYVEGKVSIIITAEAESRFVPDLQRGRHRHTPSSKSPGMVYEAYGLLHTTTTGKSTETQAIGVSLVVRRTSQMMSTMNAPQAMTFTSQLCAFIQSRTFGARLWARL
jgi:hypothetical protein